ncbi:ribosome maturation factor RimM [Mucilaginibacter myungsuensis]|uniref:Ribosome maturation factor RimM n=1 Tax=Mucilaginibacter myungsuensis TaxID=649104 RepID=A0A929PXQ4_9SPHI|nr:ribosome maturation factor RimM [Mucilaginibacter myungsuensis]MBE9663394.1 16S rRNA processing protein RimM [Mucilaginibacter myungsuensis]MDN3600131.1 ribosome maturation factor RimM [Mucilaginibacter myungsuensis]
MKHNGYFKVATVGKTKGLKGEMQLYVEFDGLEDIKFNALFIDIAGKLVPYFVSVYKPSIKNTAYVYLEDVDTIEKASVLLKKEIYLPTKLKPAMDENEFTLFDLEGFMAEDIDEGELGIITAVHEYPQQIIAACDYDGTEILFPLNENTIKGIDVPNNILTVDLPEGLLDIYLEDREPTDD